MSAWWRLAARSAWHRRDVLVLVVVSIALSAFLLLSIERVRHDARANFAQTVSGTDLIVGARTGSVQLLLYAVFRIGHATNDIRWASVERIARDPAVAWVVPIALGDSLRGFPVVGTTDDYFAHYRYGDGLGLRLARGRRFAGVYEAVLGAEVARTLGLSEGARLVLSHGDGALAGNDHADKPFVVVGVLAPTGTPVDRSVHISLASMEAIHLDWAAGTVIPGAQVSAEEAAHADLTPRRVTACLVGLKQRAGVFRLQRAIDDDPTEALMAILPGVALDELWDVVGVGERALLGMSVLVAFVSLAALVAVVLAGLAVRRRELAVLRAMGADARHIIGLLAAEGAWVTALGVGFGLAAHLAAVALAADWVAVHWGIALQTGWPPRAAWGLLGAMVAAGWCASLVPGWRAYRLSLADGLTARG